MSRGGSRTGGCRRRVRALAGALLAACASLAFAAHADRTIVYANVGGERVQRAFERLNRALEQSGVLARHGVVLRHELVHQDEPQRLRADMERIVAMRPAAIVAPGAVIAAAAKEATSTIPVIFGSWESPVGIGLVESLARPGRNLAGSTDFIPLEEKRLELLKELAPTTRRVGVLVDRIWMRQPHVTPALAEAARRLALLLELFPAETESELQSALESERGRSMQAWYVPHAEVAFLNPDFVVEAFRRTAKPVMYSRSLYVEKGGLAAYQSELDDVFEVWAKLLARVLEGVPPAIIPVERPRHFEFTLNLGAARRLGLTIPRSLLRRADRFY